MWQRTERALIAVYYCVWLQFWTQKCTFLSLHYTNRGSRLHVVADECAENKNFLLTFLFFFFFVFVCND